MRPRTVFLAGLLVLAGCLPGWAAPTVSLDGYRPATPDRVRAAGWSTDLSRADVPLESIAISAIPRDAFVPIRAPQYVSADRAALEDSDPVVAWKSASGWRAWPIPWLRSRELVLDRIDDVPIAVTFCSLCATTKVWDRRVAGSVLELGVTGLLLDGNSLLYDRATESWWRQLDGSAVVGERTGERLAELPSFVTSFGELRRSEPSARVMAPPARPRGRRSSCSRPPTSRGACRPTGSTSPVRDRSRCRWRSRE